MLGYSHIAAYWNLPLRDIIQKQIQTSHDFQWCTKNLRKQRAAFAMWQQQDPEVKHFSHAKPSSHGIGHGKHRAASKFLSLSLVLLPLLPIHLSLIHTHNFNEATLKCLLYSIEFLLIGGLEGQRWQHYLVILSFICPALTGSICAF